MKRFFVVFLSLLPVACQKPLKVYGQVPAFELTDQTGRPFAGSRLAGHVWVADFVFTNCEASCPRMSTKMAALMKATDPGVRLVSFTVDPDRDTPQALAAYARRYHADPSRWSFLTGTKEALNALDQEAFKLGTIGADFDHSTRFALVDRRGRIRGYYGIAEGNPVEKIAHDAEQLEKEST